MPTDMGLDEMLAYLRLLREALRVFNGEPLTLKDHYSFWCRYHDAEEFCDLLNSEAGISLVISRLESRRQERDHAQL